MRISEAIRELKHLQREHGDIPVGFRKAYTCENMRAVAVRMEGSSAHATAGSKMAVFTRKY
jgi:hypothetical protein